MSEGKIQDMSGAIDVARQFLHWTADEPNAEAAAQLLTKKSRESGQFSPDSGPKGARYDIGEPTREGDAVVVPVTLRPPEGVDGPSMPAPMVVVREDGAWRVDLVATMDRMFGGVIETAVNAMGQAMGEVLDKAGEAIAQAFGETEKTPEPEPPPATPPKRKRKRGAN